MSLPAWLPAEVVVLVASMAPLIESRISIILGGGLGMNIWKSFALSITGNLSVAGILIYYLDSIFALMRSMHPKCDKLVEWLVTRYKKKHSARMQTAGALSLILFVALPIPGSGAYAGSLVAYIFKFPKLLSFACVCIGVTLSGLIITYGYIGVDWLI
jgi:uncharacterized membrane protein